MTLCVAILAFPLFSWGASAIGDGSNYILFNSWSALGTAYQYVWGDWLADGNIRTGAFKDGLWILDIGTGLSADPNDCGTKVLCRYFGTAGDIPLVGEWDKDWSTKTTGLFPKSKIGIFRQGKFYLDHNGDGLWSGACSSVVPPPADVDLCLSFGDPTDAPVVGDWNDTGFTKIGVLQKGKYYLDVNGNGKWDDFVQDGAYDVIAGLVNINAHVLQAPQPAVPIYSLTVSEVPAHGPDDYGDVTLSPAGGYYQKGTPVDLTAVPRDAALYRFLNWTNTDDGSSLGSDNPLRVTMNGNMNITARFGVKGSGQYSDIVASAVKLNQELTPGSNSWGYHLLSPQGEYTIPKGQTVWFLVDPVAVLGRTGSIKIWLYDYQQDETFTQGIYIIDPNDNLIPAGTLGVYVNPDSMFLDWGQGSWDSGSVGADQKRYLVRVTEKGTSDIYLSIFWSKLF